jgi:hypothetical protein
VNGVANGVVNGGVAAGTAACGVLAAGFSGSSSKAMCLMVSIKPCLPGIALLPKEENAFPKIVKDQYYHFRVHVAVLLRREVRREGRARPRPASAWAPRPSA